MAAARKKAAPKPAPVTEAKETEDEPKPPKWRPCPKCGCEQTFYSVTLRPQTYAVHCRKCIHPGPIRNSYHDADVSWNEQKAEGCSA